MVTPSNHGIEQLLPLIEVCLAWLVVHSGSAGQIEMAGLLHNSAKRANALMTQDSVAPAEVGDDAGDAVSVQLVLEPRRVAQQRFEVRAPA